MPKPDFEFTMEQLAEGHKGGRRFLKVEPPLLIQDEKGGFSPELQRIYRLTPNLSKQK